MSEYQHYEFLAIDRRLSREEIEALRLYSSRAEISPSRFSVVYNWGDFKGSPRDFMARYFDAHVYVSNFGTSTLMLRLPGEVLSTEEIMAYAGSGFDASKLGENWLFVWEREGDEPNYEWMEDEGWMAGLAPIREEIERGDYRALYIGWLRGVPLMVQDDDDIDSEAPPVPPGLAALTPAQEALVEFLGVDKDLLEAAAQASPQPEDSETVSGRMATWVNSFSVEEARRYLLLILEGKGKNVERQLRRAFTDATRPPSAAAAAAVSRAAGELMEQADLVREQRLKREEAERQKRAEEQRRLREKILLAMAADFAAHWKLVEKAAGLGTASGYDEATRLLVDMAEAAALTNRKGEFFSRLAGFRETHVRRPALIRRLDARKLR